MNVKKSVTLRGNLKDGKLIYRPYPSNEFIDVYSSLAIGSIISSSKIDIDTSLTISCNFIKSQKFNENYQVISYEQPLQSFQVNSKKLQLRNYPITWFSINSVSEELQFSFTDFDGNKSKSDIKVLLTVYFF